MCLAGQTINAYVPKSVQNITGLGLAAKTENALFAKTMPKEGKQIFDKIMPDSMRQGILKNGDKTAKSTLVNPNSESEQAANEQNALTLRQNQANAFAAQYNGQVRFV